MSLKRAQREIDADEFAEWMAYYDIDPFGEERADLRSAINTATMVNLWSTKGARSVKPIEFMPFAARTKKRQSPEEMAYQMRQFVRHAQGNRLNGTTGPNISRNNSKNKKVPKGNAPSA